MIKEINNITLNQNEAYDLIIILDYDLYLGFYQQYRKLNSLFGIDQKNMGIWAILYKDCSLFYQEEY